MIYLVRIVLDGSLEMLKFVVAEIFDGLVTGVSILRASTTRNEGAK